MKNTITLILLIFLGVFSITAQSTISGKIIDNYKTPLPFANVILHKKESEETPKGVISDENGGYRFEAIENGLYELEVSVLGYETKKSEEFELSGNKAFDFVLDQETQVLNEVVVKSKRPIIRQTAEKLIIDIENSEMINTSLEDVMRKVPGVLVTNNGISIAGNSGVRILINGKTTEYMDVETLLRDLPADNIAKIELVEQPGAEYEASGSGAIINIILKKNVRLGTHGSVNTWIGEDEGFEYGSGFSIASYKNKLNWQTSIRQSKPTFREDLFLVRTVEEETYDQITREPYDPENLNIGVSMDYYINDKHTFGIGGRWNNRTSTRIASSETVISNGSSSDILFSENSFNREREDFNVNPYYEYKTETEKLAIDFNYIDYKNNNINNLYDLSGSTTFINSRKYIQDGQYNIKTYKADYLKSFSENLKLSFGTKYARVKTDSDLQAFLENLSGNLDYDGDNSSRFLIDEKIFALYSKVNAKLGDWSFSGGIRYENSNTDGTSFFIKEGILTEEVKKRPIKKVFPSASISRKISEDISVNLSYSYRIQRPSYNSLNSFATFLDPFSASEGNPNLKPSFTNNYQFNLTYDGQPFFVVGYRETEDVIFELIKQDNISKQIRQQEVNVEQNSNWNFRLFAPLSFIKGVEGFTGIIVVNTDYRSQTHGVDLNKWYMFWFAQASYQLPGDINFEISGNYGTGALEGQIEVDWLAELDFSFGKKFLDEKLKVNLGLSKVLNRGFVGNIDYGNGTAQVESNGSRQNIQLRLVYRFGSQFGKKKSERDSSSDEEDRIQDEN